MAVAEPQKERTLLLESLMLPEIIECLAVAAGTALVLLMIRVVRDAEPDSQRRDARSQPGESS